jgi:CDP-diacylglycerol--glycerol-3-phosphate 3-phosphatidyltransferase
VNVPNLITLSRLAVTVVCFLCLGLAGAENPDTTMVWWAFGLFIFAAATDFVDGYLARKFGMVTAFGRVADPFADKVLVCGALVMLLEFRVVLDVMATWVVVVILAREFLVTTIRGLAESQGIAFPAERLGKYKMVAQCVAVSALMTLVAGTTVFHWLAVTAVWVTLGLTVASGVQYVYRARGLLFSA